MSFVHHQKTLVPLLYLDELRQVAVSVHAVNAFDHDQHPAIVPPQFAEQMIQGGPVIVRERAAVRPGEDRSLDNAIVGECIMQNEVPRPEEMTDRRLLVECPP